VLAVLDQAIREHAGGHPNSLMAAERALWKCTRATVAGLWEERERLQATLNNTLAERDAAEHVAQSSRISAIGAESRATRAEAALKEAGAWDVVPVAWSLDGLIYDDDGTPIGTDETRVRWQAECPAPGEGWAPLYSGRPYPPSDGDVVRPADFEGAVCVLACWMAEKDDCDPHHLIWEGGPTPEPWGEVWQRYEPVAREAIARLNERATPPQEAG
jgi:hypothetical protein